MDPQAFTELQQTIVAILLPLLRPLFAFNHHGSLIYWPFLASTRILAMIAFAFTRRSVGRSFLREFRRAYFTRAVWSHASAIAD